MVANQLCAEAVHKEYLVHIPPKWHRFYEREGKRVKPLLQRNMGMSLYSAIDEVKGGREVEGEKTKKVKRGKSHRLYELLLLKEEEEGREAAKKETVRLERLVSKEKEKLKNHRSDVLWQAKAGDLGTAARIARLKQIGTAQHHATTTAVTKLRTQSERFYTQTLRKLKDLPDAPNPNLSLLKSAANGRLEDTFFKKPLPCDTLRREAQGIMLQIQRQHAEQSTGTARRIAQNREKVFEAQAHKTLEITKRIEAKAARDIKGDTKSASAHSPRRSPHRTPSIEDSVVEEHLHKLHTREAARQQSFEKAWREYEEQIPIVYKWQIENAAKQTGIQEQAQAVLIAKHLDHERKMKEAKERRRLNQGEELERRKDKLQLQKLAELVERHNEEAYTRRAERSKQIIHKAKAVPAAKVHTKTGEEDAKPEGEEAPLSPQQVREQKELSVSLRCDTLREQRAAREKEVEIRLEEERRKRAGKARDWNEVHLTKVSQALKRHEEDAVAKQVSLVTNVKAVETRMALQSKEDKLEMERLKEERDKRKETNCERYVKALGEERQRHVKTVERVMGVTNERAAREAKVKWTEKQRVLAEKTESMHRFKEEQAAAQAQSLEDTVMAKEAYHEKLVREARLRREQAASMKHPPAASPPPSPTPPASYARQLQASQRRADILADNMERQRERGQLAEVITARRDEMHMNELSTRVKKLEEKKQLIEQRTQAVAGHASTL